MPFADREHAGRLLARQLAEYWNQSPIVLALPRGGVVVGAEVARVLDAALDVLLVRKLSSPSHPEYGIGALAEDGVVFLNREEATALRLTDHDIEEMVDLQLSEIGRQAGLYRQGRPLPSLRGRTVILVDDGIATGVTVQAAIQCIRQHGATQIVLAVPVAPDATLDALSPLVDELICLETPEYFSAVSRSYGSFPQVPDDEVIRLLQAFQPVEAEASDEIREQARHTVRQRYQEARAMEREVVIETPDASLRGTLSVPVGADSVVLFAHGSGSSRMSPRNRYVAGQLQRAGLGTLLFDLLTEEEEEIDATNANYRFDIVFLARRLAAATDWLRQQTTPSIQQLGYFGASTGAAAALVAAATRPALIDAVVSRGGRPDLAGPALAHVRAPTLLIIGGDDELVLQLNQAALDQMICERELRIVPHATHLFEEPGALEQVAQLAAEWFRRYLVARPETVVQT